MNDIRLSKHFMLSEFLRSSTATARGIDNVPGASAIDSMPAGSKSAIEIISNLQALCENVLEPLREYANTFCTLKGSKGTIPIIISSGYRCKTLNKAVGGATNSQHMTGEACDIKIPDEATGKQWFVWLTHFAEFDQLIWEKSTPTSKQHWIHVSFRQGVKQRRQVIDGLVKNQ